LDNDSHPPRRSGWLAALLWALGLAVGIAVGAATAIGLASRGPQAPDQPEVQRRSEARVAATR
jgi:hypothetical protein